MVGSKTMKMSLVYLEGFTDPELHKQNLISVFPHFPTDCILTASAMGLRTRMLLVYAHARTWSETVLLQSPGPVPLQFLAAAQEEFRKQNSTSLH